MSLAQRSRLHRCLVLLLVVLPLLFFVSWRRFSSSHHHGRLRNSYINITSMNALLFQHKCHNLGPACLIVVIMSAARSPMNKRRRSRSSNRSVPTVGTVLVDEIRLGPSRQVPLCQEDQASPSNCSGSSDETWMGCRAAITSFPELSGFTEVIRMDRTV